MMLLRMLALLLALASAAAGGAGVLPVSADDDCALYLTGPGRTSAYDYSLNLLKGNFAYEGQHHCITYEAINQAYLEARNRILVSQPKGDWKAEDYASVGELILDISINLARRYALTYEEIEKGLPLIDTSKTLIREVCPPIFSHVECRAGKYRRLDGLCNNLEHPTWGATMAPFQRLIGPLFADGINAPRIAHTGRDLPLSRVVSRTMHPDDGFHDHAGTVMVIAWGQFMDHDYTLTGTPLDPINRNDPEECCKRPPHLKHPYCNEIRVPDDDYFYRLFGVKCIDFVRGFPSPRPGCRLGSRNPFNTLTGVIDGNTVYGVTDKFARKLRTGYGGLLRMNPVFKEYGLKDLLPLKLDIPDEGCTRPNKNMYCFEAGEIRVNEQLVLTVMHTLMAREHNRVAEGLAAVNPHWDDETLYQEARRINIAEIQHITYNEFLPILLGKDVMEKFGLVLEKEGYWDGYDPNVNPDVLDSFAAAAYRFGHSLLPTAVERWSKAHKFIASKRLSDLIRRPYDLYRAGVLDEYVMGLMNQVAQAMDDSITQEVTNHLFKKVGARFGMDLVSFNMQRGREFGLPGYMEFRKFCGLPGAETFQDLFGSMPNETVRKYESIFAHPIDVDLWSGGVSERPLPGSMLGPTFACIIATQFSYSRRGDRFWFELPNQPSSFTPEQLHEIRKARLARVICDNTDIIDTVQLYPMVLPDHELNPRVPCRSGIIPSMDFTKWAEPAPFHGAAAKDFVTIALVTNNATNMTEHRKSDIVLNLNITTSSPQLSTSIEPTVYKKKLAEEAKENCKADCKTAKPPLQTKIDKVLQKVINTKNNVSIKNSGHYKNNVRRKRSVQKSPLIVNYETVHPATNLKTLYIPEKQIAIPLANFNIETVHHNRPNIINTTPTNQDFIKESEESEREDISIGNSSEKSNESSRNKSEPNPGSDEYSEKVQRIDKDSNHYNNMVENEDSSTESEDNSEDSNEDKNYDNNQEKENSNSREKYRLKHQQDDKTNTHKKLPNDSIEELERIYKPSQRITFSNGKEHSSEQSDESYTENVDPPLSSQSIEISDKGFSKDHYGKRPQSSDTEKIANLIKDVDLDNFSYERIHVNDQGKVEPVRDLNENYDVLTTIQPEVESKNVDSLKEKSELRQSKDDTNDSKPIIFNDDIIKPVVELNPDVESYESVEDVDTDDKSDQSSKKNIDKQENENVKQDFERIPVNYNHQDARQKTIAKSTQDQDENDEKSQEQDTKKDTNTKVRYDEFLNTKFQDLTIKLPEIKLPDDILSYAYDPPTLSKKTTNTPKPKFFHYENKQSEEVSHHPAEGQNSESEDERAVSQEDNDHKDDHRSVYQPPNYKPPNYHGYRTKENYKNKQKQTKEQESEEEDLYEKFVRERFGKKDTFEKRSEKLLRGDYSLPENSELFQNLQNVAQRTAKLKMEAEKSGDPKGGYMWTLEYGKKL